MTQPKSEGCICQDDLAIFMFPIDKLVNNNPTFPGDMAQIDRIAQYCTRYGELWQ